MLKFVKILSGNIDSQEKATDEHGNIISRYDVKKLMEKNTRPDDNTGKVKSLFKDLEYIVFSTFSKKILESEKLDIAQGKINIADLPPLEPEEEASKSQKGQGLNIMTPKQMIVRLSILLAQLKAGNNSQKLKNEIRKIAYSLYRSKNLSKTIYNNLISPI